MLRLRVMEARAERAVSPQAPTTPDLIAFYRISKKYPGAGQDALHNVSLEIGEGEFVFLTGPSGAGKTTLLELLTREELPTSGEMVVLGRNYARLSRKDLTMLRREIGVVYQDPMLLAQMSVFGNVELALEVRGVPRRDRKLRVMEALAAVGLKDLRAKRPTELSAGEQHRAALARAIVVRPRILLADEPTGNLDPDLSEDIMALLGRLCDEGITTLVATHEWELVERAGRRRIALERGKVVADTGPARRGQPTEEPEADGADAADGAPGAEETPAS